MIAFQTSMQGRFPQVPLLPPLRPLSIPAEGLELGRSHLVFHQSAD